MPYRRSQAAAGMADRRTA